MLIDPAIWSTTTPAIPKVSCIPPCVLVLPPYQIGSMSTINFPPVTTTITEQWDYYVSETKVVTITFAPVVTSEVSKQSSAEKLDVIEIAKSRLFDRFQ